MGKLIRFDCNDVYLQNFNNLSRTQIYYGGSGSGKSVFLAQRAVFDVFAKKRNYLVCRAVGRTIRKSVFNEITKAIIDAGLTDQFSVNKTDGAITCANGYQILFSGLDDAEKVKSITPAKGVITDIWIEEATETDQDTVKSLYKRQRGGDPKTPKRLTLSFNPILKSHWIYESFFIPSGWTDEQTEYKSDSLSILKTWYVHNRFLTPEDVRDLENETDEYYRSVYTFGNWGILGNVIFKNWKVEDLSGMKDQFTNRRNGIDFGFSSDPAAVTRSHFDRMRKAIYIFDEIYETGLTNPMLAALVKPMAGADLVVCDSAEPKSIEELRREGLNVQPAIKGKDSVLYGIQWLQQQEIVIDPKCVNTISEFQQYHWKEDAHGNAMRVPVDKHNHILDALRYAYEQDANAAETTIVKDPFAAW